MKNKHFLWANDDNRAIKTRQHRTGDNLKNSTWTYDNLPKDPDGNFHTDSRDETSSHHAITEAWQSYKTLFGRSGLNNFNKELRVIVKSSGLLGAYYDGNLSKSYADFIQIEKVMSGGTLTSTHDMAAHEFAHGIDHYEGNMVYRNESGAIEESFADIFGFMAERRSEPNNWDWLIGEDATSVFSRNMSNPSSQTFPKSIIDPSNLENYPNTYPTVYKGNNWYSGSGNAGGVHINSSVQNYWFYLLSMGGTQLGQTVIGIGIDKAAKISYYSFTNFVYGNETFQEARAHSILAAEILYGKCSFEVKEVCKAWKAVGVGPLCCQFIAADYWELCRIPEPVGDGYQVKVEALNVEQLVKIYPNPATNNLTISFKEIPNHLKENGKIAVYSLDGKEILNQTYTSTTDIVNFNVTNMNSGVYFVKINSDSKVFTYKFVKQ